MERSRRDRGEKRREVGPGGSSGHGHKAKPSRTRGGVPGLGLAGDAAISGDTVWQVPASPPGSCGSCSRPTMGIFLKKKETLNPLQTPSEHSQMSFGGGTVWGWDRLRVPLSPSLQLYWDPLCQSRRINRIPAFPRKACLDLSRSKMIVLSSFLQYSQVPHSGEQTGF